MPGSAQDQNISTVSRFFTCSPLLELNDLAALQGEAAPFSFELSFLTRTFTVPRTRQVSKSLSQNHRTGLYQVHQCEVHHCLYMHLGLRHLFMSLYSTYIENALFCL
jgi:hypothetical protein